MKQLFKFAVRQKMIRENPLDGYDVAKPVPTAMPDRGSIRFNHSGQRVASIEAMLAVLAFTGMRSGELRNPQHDDVDWETGFIAIRSREGSETKSRQVERSPFTPRDALPANGDDNQK